MVALKKLERTLEKSIYDGYIDESENVIDEYLSEVIPIDSSASSKLHEALIRLATNTVSHRGEPSPVLVSALVRLASCLINIDQLRIWFDKLAPLALDSGGRENTLVERAREFLNCILTGNFYEDELQGTYVKNSLIFFEWLVEIYVGKKELVTSTMDPAASPTSPTVRSSPSLTSQKYDSYWTEERCRFVRFNCRTMIINQATRDPAGALTILNKYFVIAQYRLDILQIVSEFAATNQTAKLFKVYDTPLFESLLQCLEFDKASPALSIAATTLSMLLPHICDKLVPILPRILACFGRLCSWQPISENAEAHANKSNSQGGWSVLFESETDLSQVDVVKASLADSNDPSNGTHTSEKELEAKSPIKAVTSWEADTQTIDIAPLFTFLYGLFPVNTVIFSRQCDEYMGKNDYKRPFSDFWSRFMVRQRADLIASQFLLHPLILSQDINQECSGANARWQSFGSTSALSMFCTGLRVPDTSTLVGDQEKALETLLDDHQRRFQEVISRMNSLSAPLLGAPSEDASSLSTQGTGTGTGTARPDQPSSPKGYTGGSTPLGMSMNMWTSISRSRSGSGSNVSSLHRTTGQAGESKSGVASSPPTPVLGAKASPRLQPAMPSRSNESSNVLTFYKRELLINKNELDFANFCRHISERRVVRLQKQASILAITNLRNEELTRKNRILLQKLETYEDQAEKSQRSVRTLLREKTAYANTLLEKNRDFRARIQALEDEIEALNEHLKRAHSEKDDAMAMAAESTTSCSHLEMALEGLRQQHESLQLEMEHAKFEKQRQEEGLMIQQEDPSAEDSITSKKLEEARLEIEAVKGENERLRSEWEREVNGLLQQLADQPKSFLKQELVAQDHARSALTQQNQELKDLKQANSELSHRCLNLEKELRARKVHEEERMNELRTALMSARPFSANDPTTTEARFKGRGGAQGTVRW